MSDHLFPIGTRVELSPKFAASFGRTHTHKTGTVVAHSEHELFELAEITIRIDGDGHEETSHPDWWVPLLEPLSPPWCAQRALAALMVRT